MSLFGALNTAVSGLTAQSNAFGNISGNVANSQTVGFKRVDTSFVDYLTTSNSKVNLPGAVVAQPEYVNNIQGTLTQTDNPLGMAIAGQGFFAVSQPTGEVDGTPTYNPQQFYSRTGDFSMNDSGFLVNSAGQYLNGWAAVKDGNTETINQNALVPIQVDQSTFNPVATKIVTLAANLPATPTPGVPISSQITVYDALGTGHFVNLDWSQNDVNDWKLTISDPDPATAGLNPPVDAEVKFGTAGAADGAGTITSITGGTGATTSPGPATLGFSFDFGPASTGPGAQNITLDLGTFGDTTGMTQFAGTGYSLRGLTQDGVPPGSFTGVSTEANGNILVNYSNGQTKTVAQIPLVTFNAPNELQSQNGQSFTATQGSGSPLTQAASTNGAGNLVTGSIEGSNVDIATEFSKLIVAQQAYSSNAKVVTTAKDMLQVTLQMIG